MPKLPDTPPLNVSYSLLRTLAECPRKGAILSAGAWQGWRGGTRYGEPLARACYHSKFLYSLAQAHGIAVHRLLEAIVGALAAGERPPAHGDLWAHLRGWLGAIYRRTRQAFERAPKEGLLLSTYLGQRCDPTEVEQVRVKMRAAARRLADAELLRDLAAVGRGAIVAEGLVATPLTLPGLPPATLWAKPDLQYRIDHALHVDGVWHAPGQGGLTVFADLKSGRLTTRALGDVRTQLAVAAYAARSRGLAPHPTAGYAARVFDVSPQAAPGGDPTWLIGTRELADAERMLGDAVRTIGAWPRDAHGFVQVADVPARPGPHCHTCAAQAACAMTLTPIARAPRRGAR